MKHLASGALAVLACIGLFGGCAEALGLGGETQSIVESICRCEQFDARWPSNDEGTEFYDCSEYVEAALARDPAQTAAWIDAFEASSCNECANAETCANLPPLCIPIGEGPCSSDATCCGFDPEISTAAYCGLEETEDEEVLTRACAADPNPTVCHAPGGSCDTDAECCGSTGLLSACTITHECIAVCDPLNPTICPGCCAIVRGAIQGEPDVEVGLCVDGFPFKNPPACDQLCVESCPLNFGCVARPYALTNNAVVQVNVCAFVPPE